MARLQNSWLVVRQTITAFQQDDGLTLSAAIAFYAMLSLAPVLILAIALAGVVWEDAATQSELAGYIAELVGERAAEIVRGILANATGARSAELATVAGAVLLVFGSTAVFTELQRALNKIWRVETKGRRVRTFLWQRAMSLGIVVGIAVLLLVSIVAATAFSLISRYLHENLVGASYLWWLLRSFSTLAVFTLLFAAMFKWLPRARVRWSHVWLGGIITAILFLAGKSMMNLYLGEATFGTSYGAAGSLLALLLWVYYSTVIFLLGAELTSLLGRRAAPARAE